MQATWNSATDLLDLANTQQLLQYKTSYVACRQPYQKTPMIALACSQMYDVMR